MNIEIPVDWLQKAILAHLEQRTDSLMRAKHKFQKNHLKTGDWRVPTSVLTDDVYHSTFTHAQYENAPEHEDAEGTIRVQWRAYGNRVPDIENWVTVTLREAVLLFLADE